MQKIDSVQQSGRRKLTRGHKQLGFSLIEVLISIVILSFGLLGMVGLQAAALQGNRDARLQSTAISLARELSEMMRGNKDIALLTASNPYLGSFASPLASASPSYCLNVGATVPCASNAAIANAQMTEWLARVDAELPGAKVSICIDSAPYDSNGVPRWSCDTTGTAATTVIKVGWTRLGTNRTKTESLAFERASTPSIVFPIIPGNTL